MEKNMEKYGNYREMMTKHKIAMKNEFYIEALIIDYCIIEDRLESFLGVIGVMNEPDNYSLGNKRNRNTLRQIYEEYGEKGKTPNLRNISSKIMMVKALLTFADKPYEGTDRYLTELYKGLQKIDRVDLSDTLTSVTEWKDYRNKIIHNVMNRKVSELLDEIGQRAEDGLIYARAIDREVKKVKKSTSIRRSVNMPI